MYNNINLDDEKTIETLHQVYDVFASLFKNNKHNVDDFLAEITFTYVSLFNDFRSICEKHNIDYDKQL